LLTQSTWALEIPLIDYRSVEWSRVKRTQYFCYQRFHYSYPGPIRRLRQRLIIVPPERYGDQAVVDQRLTVTPYPAKSEQQTDRFGNCIWDLGVSYVAREIAFESIITLERQQPIGQHILTKEQVLPFYESTELTRADSRIQQIAQELAQGSSSDEATAQRISDWLWHFMSYKSGVTNVSTTAAQALVLEQGLCQDYSHIMIAMCRSLGIPARYVSGHMLADGGSHAWVEIMVPLDEERYRAIAFDPTNKRRPDLSYAIIAVGRDYRDVPPTSGSFSAPYGGFLSFEKRAGLRMVEYLDGEIIGQ
jgi:transglutaminase-like putative cysteine protease